MSPILRRRYATYAEAARYLGVSISTVRNMCREGRITAYHNGPRLIRVDLNEVDAVMTPKAVAQ